MVAIEAYDRGLPAADIADDSVRQPGRRLVAVAIGAPRVSTRPALHLAAADPEGKQRGLPFRTHCLTRRLVGSSPLRRAYLPLSPPPTLALPTLLPAPLFAPLRNLLLINPVPWVVLCLRRRCVRRADPRFRHGKMGCDHGLRVVEWLRPRWSVFLRALHFGFD